MHVCLYIDKERETKVEKNVLFNSCLLIKIYKPTDCHIHCNEDTCVITRRNYAYATAKRPQPDVLLIHDKQ